MLPIRNSRNNDLIGRVDKLSEEVKIFKILCSNYDGDFEKIEWFYNNKTEIDLTLLTHTRNKINEEIEREMKRGK